MAWHKFGAPRLSREHYSPLADKLAKKIERELGLTCDPATFRRTYAGYWQKSNGAWLWTMRVMNGAYEIGSSNPASECIKKKYRLVMLESGDEICAESVERPP